MPPWPRWLPRLRRERHAPALAPAVAGDTPLSLNGPMPTSPDAALPESPGASTPTEVPGLEIPQPIGILEVSEVVETLELPAQSERLAPSPAAASADTGIIGSVARMPSLLDPADAPPLAIFTLHIVAATPPLSTYRVALLGREGREAGPATTFTLDVSEPTLQRQLTAARELAEGEELQVRMEASREADVHALARRLSAALFADPAIREAWRAHMTSARATRALPCLTLAFAADLEAAGATSAAPLLALPWELLADPLANPPLVERSAGAPGALPPVRFLCAGGGVALIRQLRPRKPPASPRPLDGRKLRVLVLISDPIDLPERRRLDRDQERDVILNALEPLVAADLIESPAFEDAVSIAALRRRLREDEPYDLLYYTGHGGWDECADEGTLLVERDPGDEYVGRSFHLTRSAIVALLAELGIRGRLPATVILAGCLTAQETSAPRGGRFASVALAFLEAGVASVLALQYSIRDEAGLVLTEALFGALARTPGTTLESALVACRRALDARVQRDAFSAAAEAARAASLAPASQRATIPRDSPGSPTSPTFDWERDAAAVPLWQRLAPRGDLLAWAIPALYRTDAITRPFLDPAAVRAALDLDSTAQPPSDRRRPAPREGSPGGPEHAESGFGALEYMARGYVGRHREQRTVRELLTARDTAVRAVVLSGLGGVGKTVFATQVVQRLLADETFEGVITVRVLPETTVDEVFAAAEAYLTARGELRFAAVRTLPTMPVAQKASFLASLLVARPWPVLVLLDNCEEWVSADHHTLREPEVAALLEALLRGFSAPGCGSRLLLTSRYELDLQPMAQPEPSDDTDDTATRPTSQPPRAETQASEGVAAGPSADAVPASLRPRLVAALRLTDLQLVEAVRLLGRQTALAEMPAAARIRAARALGGHPFTLTLFAARAAEHGWRDALDELPSILREVNARRLLLERVYGDLPPDAQKLLRRAAWLQRPMPLPLAGMLLGWEAGVPASWGVDYPEPGLTPEALVSARDAAISALLHAGVARLVEVADELVPGRMVPLSEVAGVKTVPVLRETRPSIARPPERSDAADATGTSDATTVSETSVVGPAAPAMADAATAPGPWATPDTGNPPPTRRRFRLGASELRLELPVPVREWATAQAEFPPSATPLSPLAPPAALLGEQGVVARLAIGWHVQVGQVAREREDERSEVANLLAAWDYAEALDDHVGMLRLADALVGRLVHWGGTVAARRLVKRLGAFTTGETHVVTLINLGMLAREEGRLEEADRLYTEALAHARRLGDEHGAAGALDGLGRLAREQGRLEEADRLYTEALGIFRRLGDEHGAAVTLSGLGNLAKQQGRLEEAARVYTEELAIGRRIGDQYISSGALHGLGNLAQLQGRHEEARQRYGEALTLYRALDNPQSSAAALTDLGNVAWEQMQFEGARHHYEEALRYARRLSDPRESAKVLNNLGNLAREQGRLEEAVGLYTEALALRRALDDPREVAIALHNLAGVAQKQGRFEEAGRLYTEALARAVHLGDPHQTARTLYGLAELAREQGRLEEAVGLYTEALVAFRDQGDQLRSAAALNSLAELAREQGRLEEATDLLTEALALRRALDDPREVAIARAFLADLAQRQGRPEEAVGHYTEALAAFRSLDVPPLIAGTLHELGTLAREQGQLEEADRFFTEARALYHRLGDTRRSALALHELGLLARERGRPEEAVGHYTEALAAFRSLDVPPTNAGGLGLALDDREMMAHTLHSLAELARDQGQVEEASVRYTEALELHRALGDGQGIATALNNLGNLAREQGRLDEAVGLYEEALALRRTLDDPRGCAIVLHNLAVLARERGQLEEAVGLYEEALALRRTLDDRPMILSTLHLLADLAQEQRRLDEEGDLLAEALVLARALDNQPMVAIALNNLGVLAEEQGQADEATRRFTEALAAFRSLDDRAAVATALSKLAELSRDQGLLEEATRLYTEALGFRYSLDDQRASAIILYNLGVLAQERGQFEEATRYYADALTLHRGLDDQPMIVTTLHNLGDLVRERRRLEEATGFYEEALVLARTLDDPREVATVLHKLAELAREQGRLEEADRLYSQALAAFRSLGDDRAVAAALNSLGMSAQEQGRPEEATVRYEEALAAFRALDDPHAVATVLHNLGDLAHDTARLEEATGFFTEALTLERDLDDQHEIAVTLNKLGELARKQERPDEARNLYSEALALARERDDVPAIATSLHNLGNLAHAGGRLEEADHLLTEALALRHSLDNQRGCAGTLNSLGALAQAQGRLEEADRFLAEALATFRVLDDRRGCAAALSNLGMLARQQGRLEAAADLLTEARRLHRALGNQHDDAVTLHHLVELRWEQGRLEEVGDLLTEVRGRGDPRQLAATLRQLGVLAWQQERLEEADRFLAEALALDRDLGNPRQLAAMLHMLGVLAAKQGRSEEAIDFLNEALARHRALREESEAAAALNNLGSVAGNQGRIEEAIRLYKEALALARSIGDVDDGATALYYLGGLAWEQGRPEEAFFCGFAAAVGFDQLSSPRLREALGYLRWLREKVRQRRYKAYVERVAAAPPEPAYRLDQVSWTAAIRALAAQAAALPLPDAGGRSEDELRAEARAALDAFLDAYLDFSGFADFRRTSRIFRERSGVLLSDLTYSLLIEDIQEMRQRGDDAAAAEFDSVLRFLRLQRRLYRIRLRLHHLLRLSHSSAPR